MKILVILTGGTIASVINGDCINAYSDTAYNIIKMYRDEHIDDSVELEVKQPFTILSENYTSVTYNLLIDFLTSVNYSEYDGVIITHGSDTLSYTSAMVGMLFCDTEIPIMITASDYPLSEKKSNGLSNFSACIEFIKCRYGGGVFTAYGAKGATDIYVATRICEADPITDKFAPFGDGIVAKCIDNVVTEVNIKLLNLLKTKRSRVFKDIPLIKDNVLLLKVYPNQNYDCYNIDGMSAVVIYMYHSATACTVGESTSIEKFTDRCTAKGVAVYLASFKNKAKEYATSRAIEKHNVTKLYNISKESAYVKALLSYNQIGCIPEKLMNTNIYFECS